MEDFIEQVLDFKVIKVTKVKFQEGTYHVYCESKIGQGVCPVCGGLCGFRKQHNERRIKDLPLSGKAVELHLKVWQYVCEKCNRHFYEQFPFVAPGSEMTFRLESFLYDMTKGSDLTSVCHKFKIGWKTANRLLQTYGAREVSAHGRSCFETVRHLGIDEISLKKGHRDFVAVLVDLERKIVIDIVESREKAVLMAYFKEKGQSFCEQVQVFCSDMWEGFLNLAKEIFPNVSIVTDRFHFFMHCNDALDSARKYFKSQIKSTLPQGHDLRGLRFKILKKHEDLSPDEKTELQKILDNKNLADLNKTYKARNELREIFEQRLTVEDAKIKLKNWIENNNTNRFFFKFIKLFNNHFDSIANYFQHRVSSSIIEGFNNKLKLIKRRAFGFLRFQSFKLKAISDFI